MAKKKQIIRLNRERSFAEAFRVERETRIKGRAWGDIRPYGDEILRLLWTQGISETEQEARRDAYLAASPEGLDAFSPEYQDWEDNEPPSSLWHVEQCPAEPTVADFVRILKCSDGTIRKVLARLRAHGFIE